MKYRLHLPDEDSTLALGEGIGRSCLGGETLLLTGELGAGKTTLIRGVARGLGITRGVKSPTFQLLREYHGRLTLYHADLYRIEGEEINQLGLDELPGPGGVLAVEWAERGFWNGGLRIRLDFETTGRGAVLATQDADHEHLIDGTALWNG
jgi:tRNA threonylcarbamoyladenosine biosynthesis protein TsaE